MVYMPQQCCNIMKETCTFGSIKNDLDKLKSDKSSFIHEHVEFLYFMTCLMKPNKILEIGTGAGHSTLAFALGCSQNNRGVVVTLDIKDCVEAKNLIDKNGLSSSVIFITHDSADVKLWGTYDIIFIDGSHEYKHVIRELERYTPHLNPGGWLILHDTTNPAHPDVVKALNRWYERNDVNYDRFDFFHCNGLSVMRKVTFNYRVML